MNDRIQVVFFLYKSNIYKNSIRVNCLTIVIFFLFNYQISFGEIIEQIYYLVDEQFITQLDFESEINLAKKNPDIDYNPDNHINVMSNLIITKLIENKLIENNLAIKESDITNYISAIVQKNNLGSIENFITLLANSENLSYDEYRTLVYRKLSFQYYSTRIISIPPINNREIEEYYQKNRKTEFRVKDPIFNLSALTMSLKQSAGFSEKIQIQKRMNEIRENIKSGSISFEQAVKKYSEDEATKPLDGLLGWVNLNQIGIGANNIKALTSLPKGAISDLIPNKNGISIYRVNDIIEKGELPYEMAIQQVRNKIFQRKQKETFNNSLKQLIESSVIVAKNPKLKVDFNF